MPAAPADPLLGMVLDREFRIDAKLSAGGFGVIYRATHLPSRRAVALKVLHKHLDADPQAVARFRREGKTLAQLRDPHTVVGRDVVRADTGTLYIAMELLQGVSLHKVMKQGPIAWRRAVRIARGIASSLREAHDLGIIHRDLKPENIHLESIGGVEHVKVLDFGIAKLVELADRKPQEEDLTQAGTWIGTLDYMSPEQMLTNVCDGRSDLYSLGVLLYEMIAGRRPFHDKTTAAQILAAIYQQKPASLATHVDDVPHALDEIVAKLLRRDPDDRIASAAELMTLLELLDGGDDDGATRVHEVRPPSRRRFARGSERQIPSDEVAATTPSFGSGPTGHEPTAPAEPIDVDALEATEMAPAPTVAGRRVKVDAAEVATTAPRRARTATPAPVVQPVRPSTTMVPPTPAMMADTVLPEDMPAPVMPPAAHHWQPAQPGRLVGPAAVPAVAAIAPDMPTMLPHQHAYPVHPIYPVLPVQVTDEQLAVETQYMHPHQHHAQQQYVQPQYAPPPQAPSMHAIQIYVPPPRPPTNPYEMPDMEKDTFARRLAWGALFVVLAAGIAYIKAHI